MKNSLALHGYFRFCEYYEWNEKENKFNDPIKIRYKQNDEGTQGVSSTGKAEHLEQDIQGTPIVKKVFTIKVIEPIDYILNSKVKLDTGETYTILEKFDDFRSVNSINSLQFPRKKDNREYVLKLGQR